MPTVASEVKSEILSKVKSGEPVITLSRQYGVSYQSIYSWLKSKALGTVSLLEYNRLKNENRQLKEMVGVLSLELEKSKKKTSH